MLIAASATTAAPSTLSAALARGRASAVAEVVESADVELDCLARRVG